jgi:hypothetical protein
MNRKPTHPPIDPHEWFSGSIYHLGKSTMLKIWNVSERTMERWSADKAMTASVTKNAVDMLGITLEKLMEKGKAEFARSAVDFLAKIVGCQLESQASSGPDKHSIAEECLDDLPIVAALHRAIMENQPEPIVRGLLSKAKQELDEDYQAYVLEQRDTE